MNTEIQTQLHELALKRSLPFCYNDYIECPDGRCPKCGSDDLMRMFPGVGCGALTGLLNQFLNQNLLKLISTKNLKITFVNATQKPPKLVGWSSIQPL